MHHYTPDEVARTIDHAVLKPNQTELDVRESAAMCMERGVASLCVRPCDVALAKSLLKDSSVMVSCVLSFPHGDDTSETKVFQAKQAIADGVQEIDMVMNIGQFLSGNYERVHDDIQAVVDLAHTHEVHVKVILESGYLTLDQVGIACEIAYKAGADFVKTSTGFASESATPEVIERMVEAVGGKMGIKASGGIRSWEQAVGFLEQGATRLGVGAAETILDGGVAVGNY